MSYWPSNYDYLEVMKMTRTGEMMTREMPQVWNIGRLKSRDEYRENVVTACWMQWRKCGYSLRECALLAAWLNGGMDKGEVRCAMRGEFL